MILLNVPPHLIHIFFNYFKGRTFPVRTNNSISSSPVIETGVTQGGGGGYLVPDRLTFYINDSSHFSDILLALYPMKRHTTIMLRNISLFTLITRLLYYLQDFYIWRTKVNAAKSAAMIFSKYDISPEISLSLNYDDKSWVINYKYLNIYIDSKLTRPGRYLTC